MVSVITMDERPEIDTTGARLVYVQVADHLAGRIERGELAPGSRLPPERELATFYGVSYDTIRRATAALRERGLIETVHGRGTYVARRPAE
jgi:DNA-binding GntR family transcriptional regulator